MKRGALCVLVAVLLTVAAGLIAAHVRPSGQMWAYEPRAVRGTRAHAAIARPDGAVNVNTASLAELCEIKGVGATLGQAIIDERERNGPFSYPADLLNVKGIGDKTLQKLLGQLTLGDAAP